MGGWTGLRLRARALFQASGFSGLGLGTEGEWAFGVGDFRRGKTRKPSTLNPILIRVPHGSNLRHREERFVKGRWVYGLEMRPGMEGCLGARYRVVAP